MIKQYILAIIILIITAFVVFYVFYQAIDCNTRSTYWNNKGIYIDSWDYKFECDYPPIP